MSQALIRGVPVHFPYEPYPIQLVFMERVLEAVQESKDALLESPTGTGKTACLLVAVLAWQQSLRGEAAVPRVFYSSRTHSQLGKVIKELSSSPYHARMTIQGSRQQLCIHPAVEAAKPALKNGLCRSLVGAGRCKNYEAVATHVAKRPHVAEVTDIEDLVAMGRAECVCPYYLARERTKTAEITFLPYNYLIDPTARRHMSEELSGSVLIFDEAHNLDSVCADASSFDLRDGDVSESIDAIKLWMNSSPIEAAMMATQLPRLTALLAQLKLISVGDHAGAVLPQAFEKAGITMMVAEELAEALDGASSALAEANVTSPGVHAIVGALRIMFSTPGQLGETAMSVSRYYRTHVAPADSNGGRLISYWCFHPGIALRVLRAQHGIRCIILASGTLSPMDALASELGSPFPVRLENPHVIHSSQIWAGVVSCGPGGIKLESTYQNRNNKDHIRDLGQALVNFCRLVPDGLLVFFPSYTTLDVCVNAWQEAGESVWAGMLRHKRIVQEPRLSSQCGAAIADFQEKIKDGSKKGVVFLAVCRGKVAEGLDFSDCNGRAVVIIGVPFPNAVDARVAAKKKFLDAERRKNPQMLSGDEWYQQQAACAVNQAIGRVIRHRFDYGAMIFLDARFENLVTESSKPFISTWIRPFVKTYPEFGPATVSLTRFFRNSPKMVEELRLVADAQSKTKAEAADEVMAGTRKRSAFAVREPEVVAEDSKMQKIQQAQGFLATAKNALGPDKFGLFQQSLRKYRAKDITIQHVISDCLPVFLSVEDGAVRADLLKGFETFIPPKHHAEYHHLSGQMQLLPSSVLTTSASRQRPVVAAPSRKPEQLEEVIRARAAAKMAERAAVNERAKEEPVLVCSASPVKTPSRAEALVGDETAAVATAVAAIATKAVASPSGKPTCPICLDSFKQPFSAVCGHICCHTCWQSWLQQKLECPVCKDKVRFKQLRKIYW